MGDTSSGFTSAERAIAGWIEVSLGLDIKSYAMAVLKIDFLTVTKTTMPRRWFDDTLPHTHRALDDAIEQGVIFCRMLAENLKATD